MKYELETVTVQTLPAPTEPEYRKIEPHYATYVDQEYTYCKATDLPGGGYLVKYVARGNRAQADVTRYLQGEERNHLRRHGERGTRRKQRLCLWTQAGRVPAPCGEAFLDPSLLSRALAQRLVQTYPSL